MTPIPQELIEKALALTGKTMEDMEELKWVAMGEDDEVFSYPKFCYYLLSPEFIEKYDDVDNEVEELFIAKILGEAIYEYQKGNSAPIISLLTKI